MTARTLILVFLFTDIDECTEYPGICGSPFGSCNNTKGGYACRCLIGEYVNNSHCEIGMKMPISSKLSGVTANKAHDSIRPTLSVLA